MREHVSVRKALRSPGSTPVTKPKRHGEESHISSVPLNRIRATVFYITTVVLQLTFCCCCHTQ